MASKVIYELPMKTVFTQCSAAVTAVLSDNHAIILSVCAVCVILIVVHHVSHL